MLSPLERLGDGHSVWGAFNIKKNVSLFARIDDAKPSKDLAPALENKYVNLGVVFQPVAKVDLAVVYKQDKVDNGTLKTSNGTIGGTEFRQAQRNRRLGAGAVLRALSFPPPASPLPTGAGFAFFRLDSPRWGDGARSR